MKLVRIAAGYYSISEGHMTGNIIRSERDNKWVALVKWSEAQEDGSVMPFTKVFNRFQTLASVKMSVARWASTKTIPVRSVMNGKIVNEGITTPYSCSVASENYWSS